MIQSAQIQKRQSEIRQELAKLAANDKPTEEQRTRMDTLDTEYSANESRYRAALVAEDTERKEADKELDTREARDWSGLVGKFEMRQVALHMDEGKALDGATAEVVAELRSRGGYRGVPVPYEALEQRAGETVASGVPDPVQVKPIIERLFPNSVAGAMGARMVNVASGELEYPITTSAVTAGWASSETGDVSGPTQYQTTGRTLKPNHNLGIQMKITRQAMKQAGGIEEAVRRDMRGAIQAELDKAIFLGTGASGQPAGVIAKGSAYGITDTAVGAAATWAAFRSAIVTFITGNAATGPAGVRVLIRPEVWDSMDDAKFDAGSGITEYDKFASNVGSVVMSANALAAPTGDPVASKALLSTTAGGVSPIFVATWGAVDLIRDPYSDAASGGLRLTGLVTVDVNVSRTAQLQTLSGLQ